MEAFLKKICSSINSDQAPTVCQAQVQALGTQKWPDGPAFMELLEGETGTPWANKEF